MDRSAKFLYLGQEDVIAAGGLDMARTLADVEKVLALRDKGECQAPLGPAIFWEGGMYDRLAQPCPGWVGGEVNMTGIKWAHIYPDNRQRRNLPSISGIIILNDSTTGFPVAVMDGTVLSAMRTGAATGVGAKYLARPDAETVGLLGAGVYSRTQLMALRLVLPHLKQVKVFALSPERTAAWAQEMERQLEVPIRIAGTAREAVENSDVVVSVTGGKTASQPYVEPDWMAEGSLFSAVSDVDPKPELILASDRVVVDTYETLVHGAGHISNLHSQGLLKREDVVEIGEIINGKQPGRRSARERIFYNPWGISIEDIITAHSVYEEAKRKGLGQELYLWREPKWT